MMARTAKFCESFPLGELNFGLPRLKFALRGRFCSPHFLPGHSFWLGWISRAKVLFPPGENNSPNFIVISSEELLEHLIKKCTVFVCALTWNLCHWIGMRWRCMVDRQYLMVKQQCLSLPGSLLTLLIASKKAKVKESRVPLFLPWFWHSSNGCASFFVSTQGT
jgi:hypothetical protein